MKSKQSKIYKRQKVARKSSSDLPKPRHATEEFLSSRRHLRLHVLLEMKNVCETYIYLHFPSRNNALKGLGEMQSLLHVSFVASLCESEHLIAVLWATTSRLRSKMQLARSQNEMTFL